MTRRMLVGPFSHASHRLDRAFGLARRMRRSRSKRQSAGYSDSDHLGAPHPVNLTVSDAVAVASALAETSPETKPISHLHFSSDGGHVSQGHDRRRSRWFAPWI
jgi:hypothetical protein